MPSSARAMHERLRETLNVETPAERCRCARQVRYAVTSALKILR
jgi:hypothetical protein